MPSSSAASSSSESSSDSESAYESDYEATASSVSPVVKTEEDRNFVEPGTDAPVLPAIDSEGQRKRSAGSRHSQQSISKKGSSLPPKNERVQGASPRSKHSKKTLQEPTETEASFPNLSKDQVLPYLPKSKAKKVAKQEESVDPVALKNMKNQIKHLQKKLQEVENEKRTLKRVQKQLEKEIQGEQEGVVALKNTALQEDVRVLTEKLRATKSRAEKAERQLKQLSETHEASIKKLEKMESIIASKKLVNAKTLAIEVDTLKKELAKKEAIINDLSKKLDVVTRVRQSEDRRHRDAMLEFKTKAKALEQLLVRSQDALRNKDKEIREYMASSYREVMYAGPQLVDNGSSGAKKSRRGPRRAIQSPYDVSLFGAYPYPEGLDGASPPLNDKRRPKASPAPPSIAQESPRSELGPFVDEDDTLTARPRHSAPAEPSKEPNTGKNNSVTTMNAAEGESGAINEEKGPCSVSSHDKEHSITPQAKSHKTQGQHESDSRGDGVLPNDKTSANSQRKSPDHSELADVTNDDEGLFETEFQLNDEDSLAATKIQCRYRGYRVRKQRVLEQRRTQKQQNIAAIKIQARYRGYTGRRELERRKIEEGLLSPKPLATDNRGNPTLPELDMDDEQREGMFEEAEEGKKEAISSQYEDKTETDPVARMAPSSGLNAHSAVSERSAEPITMNKEEEQAGQHSNDSSYSEGIGEKEEETSDRDVPGGKDLERKQPKALELSTDLLDNDEMHEAERHEGGQAQSQPKENGESTLLSEAALDAGNSSPFPVKDEADEEYGSEFDEDDDRFDLGTDTESEEGDYDDDFDDQGGEGVGGSPWMFSKKTGGGSRVKKGGIDL